MGLGQLSKILFSLFLLALISAPLSSDASAASLREAIQTRIDTGAGGGLGDDDDERMLRVHDFYRERNYEPIWTADGGANNKARMLAKLLNAATDEALHPNTYRADVLNDMISASDGETLSGLELVLSKALIDYGRDLGSGTVVPNRVNKDVFVFPKGPTPEGLLARAAASDDIPALVESLKPQTPNYARLRAKLAEYRVWAQRGGWGTVPAGATLKPGMEQDRVLALRQRMISGCECSARDSKVCSSLHSPIDRRTV